MCFNATYLTKSNNSGLIHKIDFNKFERIKEKSINIRKQSDALGDTIIDNNNDLAIYGFYSEYIVGFLLGIYSNFDDFYDRLNPEGGLDGGVDLSLPSGITIQVKYTQWYSNGEHSGDIMNQFERKLSSDIYILVTRGDEFVKESLRIVGWTTKEKFSELDNEQKNHGYIKKRQRKINRCTIQTNLFKMSELESKLNINFNGQIFINYKS